MYKSLYKKLNYLANTQQTAVLCGGLKGVERECLRVTQTGAYSLAPHPVQLGSALTHPYLTTDYSEALLEFVTPPFADVRDTLRFLHEAHHFVYTHLAEEMLWATSMPCVVSGDESIPLARYGSSNVGKMKYVYRRGLGLRYGRVMQVIAGVHFNYSLPSNFWKIMQVYHESVGNEREIVDTGYFGLMRNFFRHSWLVLYLFGCSPCMCRSFLGGHPRAFKLFDPHTFYEPFATSLRMSDIGYRNKIPDLKISDDSLNSYINSLQYAINTPYAKYQELGVLDAQGEHQQLNAHILQIENEYYSGMRPKQPPKPEQKPSVALQEQGVEYVELRLLDVNAFSPIGVTEDSLRFLEVFLIFCALADSPLISDAERLVMDRNQLETALNGRDADLYLQRGGESVRLQVWALEVFDLLAIIAEMLDTEDSSRAYQQAVEKQRAVIKNGDLTPSAQMLAEMRVRGETFFGFALRMTEQHRDYFRALPEDVAVNARYEKLTVDSWAEQRRLETDSRESFVEFLQRYFAGGGDFPARK